MKNLKLRYYLRGLGIGIVVTVLIVGIVGKRENAMTDAQVRERALELGMIDADSVVLSRLQGDIADKPDVIPENEPEENGEADSMKDMRESEGFEEETDGQREEQHGTDVSEETEALEETEASEETEVSEETEASEEMPEVAASVKLEIRSGASSYSVSKDLEKAGLIEDAGDFDDYLCQNGYSRSIRVGTYEIEVGTDEEEIAKIITGKR